MIKEFKETDKDNIKEGISLLYFYSPTCVPCKKMLNKITKEEEKFEYPIYKIDATNINNESILDDYNVMSIPTLVVLTNGEPTAHFGYTSTQKILEVL